MNARIHAVVPIKDTSDAKRRLANVLCAARRQQLALAMFEDVLATLTGVRELAGIVAVTVDPAAATIAARYGARVSNAGAREGHTGAVAAAARELAAEAMLTLPGDIRQEAVDAARRCAIEPTVVRLPRIALDIDTPDDLALFLATPSPTRTRALLEQWRLRLHDAMSPTATG